MKTKVFSHRGIIGIQSSYTADGLLNDPTQPGQLGFVADASQVEIHPEALELLKKVKRSHDDIGDVDVFGASDGKVIFAWLGGPMRALNPEEVEGSSSYDASLLKSTDGVETPQDFINFVNSELDSESEEE